jgi:hypothetical protein
VKGASESEMKVARYAPLYLARSSLVWSVRDFFPSTPFSSLELKTYSRWCETSHCRCWPTPPGSGALSVDSGAPSTALAMLPNPTTSRSARPPPRRVQ